MKKTIIFIAAIAICLFDTSVAWAQNIDKERMKRDINIMEKVLGEIFKTAWESEDETIRVFSGSFSFSGDNKIQGSYIPDYGIIFMIPSGPYLRIINISGDEQNIQFKYSDNEKNTGITRETVVARIQDFLMNYGSTIGQLDNDSKITVIYETSHSGNNYVQMLSDKDNPKDKPRLPTIRVSVQKSAIEAYRTGAINEDQFKGRLTISTSENDRERQDLNIMSKILTTSFEDDISDNFQLDEDLNHFYLDGFGAIFQGEASYGSGFWGLNIAVSNIRKKLKNIANKDSLNFSFDDKNRSLPSNDKEDEKLAQELNTAYENFISTLKGILIDYGPTLKSVQSDENILISLSVSTVGNELPEHVDLQIKKSVLEAVDSGDLSREQAMEEITVREY